VTSRPARRQTGRTPGRSTRASAARDNASSTSGPSPVDVRLMGDDAAVRQLVAALQQAANCGPATYRSMRDSDGTGVRAYLSVIVPPQEAG
jgi:hypothetical protein